MRRIVTWRLGLAIPLLVIVSFITFALVAIAPGDPAATLLGAGATPERVAQVRAQLGLDQPLLEQYWNWFSHAIRGDFGESLLTGQTVNSTISSRLGVTLCLVIGATLVAAVVGVAIGMYGALRGGWIARFVEGLATLAFAVPVFWLSWLVIGLFALRLNWFPASNYVPFSESPSEWLRSLVLPVCTLAIPTILGVAKQTRDSMQETMARDFVAALRADGMSEAQIVWRHAFKNAAVPIVTIVGVFFVGMLGATVFVETIFTLGGLGSLAVTSAQNGDYPVVQGVVLVFCLLVVAINLGVEVLYGWLNPKARQP